MVWKMRQRFVIGFNVSRVQQQTIIIVFVRQNPPVIGEFAVDPVFRMIVYRPFKFGQVGTFEPFPVLTVRLKRGVNYFLTILIFYEIAPLKPCLDMKLTE